MKRNIQKLVLAIIALVIAIPSWGETSPKREHRSAWVTTCWRMDWPTTYGTGTSVAASQKSEADAILDIMYENGFNAAYFQVRGMCDAMYKSSYEPWSSYLTGSRGTAPSYDPLEYWVQACHERGMECYAWINPYRYESSITGASWTGSNDYRTTHPDWIMEYNNASIINPGIEAVQQRIVDVISEIVTNYDVDGIIFDDYFYLNSVPLSQDSELYAASGSSLSQADWRRENVNTMVRKVYNAIQSIKPYVKFGISPAGVAYSSASKYGINTSLVSGMSDWQYSQIYSDPLAWLAEGTIDFISPQCYWTTTHGTNPYAKLSQWWSETCANVFQRHFYSSHSISFLNGDNTTTNYKEIATQIQYNRDYTGNNAPGCVLFASRDFSGVRNSGLAPYLKTNKFQNIAIPPAMTWKSASDPGVVSNMALSGSTLTWTGVDNMRYAVYAVPDGTDPGSDVSSDYLIGIPYETSYDVSGYTSGYQLGVSIVDRHSNEYTVTWLGSGSTVEQLGQVTIHTPTDGSTTAETFNFTWDAIDGATYTLEISTSSAFSTVNFSKTTTSTSVASTEFNLAAGTKYYWRVKASKDGYIGSTSYVCSFTTYSSGSSSGSGSTTDLVKDPATYSSVGNLSIENLWIYSVNTDNYPSNLTISNRGMAALNGNVYIAQQGGTILEFSGETGELLRTITLTGDCKTSSSGTSLSYPTNDIFVDGAGNLCVSNLTLNVSSQPLTVCTVNLSTGATTRVFESSLTSTGRIDYAAAMGDVTTTGGQIWAAVASSNTVYKWERKSSGSWTAYGTTIGSYYTNSTTSASSNGTAPRIMPISSTQFILDGHNSAPTLYTFVTSGTATLSDSFANNTSCAPTQDNWNGLCTATLGGTPIFAYVSQYQNTAFNIVSNPSNFNFAQMQLLWTVPSNGLGNASNSSVTAQPAAISNADGSVTLFVYAPLNGLAAYKLTSSATETPKEDLETVSLTSPSNGATTTNGFDFAWNAINGATYIIEVATNTTFTNIVATATTTSSTYSSSNFNLTAGTTYYWRVKAEKEGYNSSTSSTYSFKTATPNLDPVTLTSPSAGATVANGFNFTWSAISGATYTLEISKSASFSSVDYRATTSATSYSSNNFSLAANTTYYWRVTAAVSGYNSSTTDPQAFTTPMETLASVTLNSPVGGATVAESFNFSWSAISGATYTIEVSALATFATVMYSGETTSTTFASSNIELTSNTKYYWRITASKEGYNSSVSATESFVTPADEVVNPTPSDLPTDPASYEVKSGLKIQNLWIYSINTSNFPEQLGRDQRGMAAYNGNVYVSERANGVGYLIEFDGKTGEYLRTITLTGDYLTTASGATLGYPCNDVFVDGGNHLCVSNLVTSFHSSGQITICTVDVSTGATTRVFESALSDISVRIDHCMVWGDITASGAKVYGAAAAGSAYSSSTRPRPGSSTYDYRKRVYCWTRDSSGNWTASYKDAYSYYPSSATSFGTAPRVLPVSDTKFIIDGSATYPTPYSYSTWSAVVQDNFDSNTSIKPNGMLSAGMCVGKVDDKPLYIYAYDDQEVDFFDFAIVYNPNDFDYASMEMLWTVPQNGLGNVSHSYVSAIPAAVNNADGTMTLYIYVPNNGLAAYLISDENYTSIEDIYTEDSNAAIKVINRVAYVSEQADVINVHSAAGTLVASASNCNTINLASLPAGVYLISAQNGDNSMTQKVAIK